MIVLLELALAAPITAQSQTPPPLPPKPQIHSSHINFKFPPKAERKPVPFELVNGVLVFKAIVNGQEVWAALDNGSGMSVIDKQFASDQNIATGPVVSPLVTASGTVERRIALDVPLTLPGQVSLTAPFSVVDLRFLAMGTGRPIMMVVGREYFANLTFVILPSRGSFEVGPSGTLRISPPVPFAPIEDDLVRVRADVGGRTLSLLVDLGANGQILLSPAAWSRLGLDKAPQTESWQANLNGKLVDVKKARLPRVAIGPFVKQNVEVTRQPTMLQDADGYVGLDFLASFNFAIDVKGRKLWLIAPVKKANAREQSDPSPK